MGWGTTASAIGWVHRLAVITDSVNEAEVADGLLEELEARFAEAGARKVVTIVENGSRAREHLDRRDYRVARREPLHGAPDPSRARGADRAVGGLGPDHQPGPGGRLQGLEEAKEMIERRVILPLAEPELAARHSVSPPKAIVLFGPPGTGKTTFAKGIASRLAGRSSRSSPSELAGRGPRSPGQAAAETFDRVLELPPPVVFVDEVEDLAVDPHARRRVSPSVTNEFLRQIPRLRDGRTTCWFAPPTWSRRLDSGLPAPGRFDYVLPVGPPDRGARARSGSATSTRSPTRSVDIARSSRRASCSPPPTSSSRPARPRSGRSSASTSRPGRRARPRTSSRSRSRGPRSRRDRRELRGQTRSALHATDPGCR